MTPLPKMACGLVLLFAAGAVSGAQQPAFTPAPLEAGTLRSWGNDQMRGTMSAWEQAFRKHHPEIAFEDTLLGSGSGMAGIITGTSELSLLGRPATANEIKGFEWVFRNKPLGIKVMTGSLKGEGKSAALAVFVARSNPIRQIQMAQLATILGCPADERATPAWALAGATGPLAARPIHAYIPDMSTNTGAFLQQAVQGEKDCWNWNIVKEYKDAGPDAAGPRHAPAGRQIVAALDRDPGGLAIATLDYANPRIKAIPLADKGSAVSLSPDMLIDAAYPLTRTVYIYINRRKDKPVDPKVKEFLRFILSPEGQALIPQSGSYLPLNPAARAEQLRKLD